MKKMILLTTVCMALMMCGCGSKGTEGKTEVETMTATDEVLTTDGHTTEKFTIPPRETFAEIPAEAEQSFDTAWNLGRETHNDSIGALVMNARGI